MDLLDLPEPIRLSLGLQVLKDRQVPTRRWRDQSAQQVQLELILLFLDLKGRLGPLGTRG